MPRACMLRLTPKFGTWTQPSAPSRPETDGVDRFTCLHAAPAFAFFKRQGHEVVSRHPTRSLHILLLGRHMECLALQIFMTSTRQPLHYLRACHNPPKQPFFTPGNHFSTMLYLTALWALVALLHSSFAYYPAAPGLVRDTAAPSPYTFDLNAGADLQAQTSEKPATALEFTNEGGTPYSMPYDYQRIGSDGKETFQFVI